MSSSIAAGPEVHPSFLSIDSADGAGPPSELERLIQADREAKEAQRAAKNKLNLERKELEKLENSGGAGAQSDWAGRPGLVSDASFDSTTAPAGLMASGGANGGDEAGSDAGAGDADSLIGSLVDEPAAPGRTPEKAAGGKGKRGAGPKGQKAKQPRKSKLAQEIGPEDGMDIDA